MVIAMIGGVGAGKSTVLSLLRERGFRVYRSDDMAKAMYRPGSKIYAELIHVFSGDVADAHDGHIVPGRLAGKIYQNPRLREKINEIVHPAVWEKIFETMERAEKNQEDIVIETALPTKEFVRRAEETWFVYVSPEIRIARVMRDRGYTREKAEAILQAQYPDESYREMSDVVIDNSGTREELEREVYEHCQRLERKCQLHRNRGASHPD